MAKGNLIQGMGRGAIGDVVLTRINGEQVSRVRNRNPRNPKSPAQLYQRAIMATVMQAYSAGKEIFNHSFQGYAVGTPSQARFMSLNLRKMRAQLAEEINNDLPVEDCVTRVVGPGAMYTVPNELIISDGKYEQKAFSRVQSGEDFSWALPDTKAGETVAHYAARVGLVADDYYTFVCFILGTTPLFVAPDSYEDPYGICYDCAFGYLRLHVKSNIASITSEALTLTDIFDVDHTSNIITDVLSEGVNATIHLRDLDASGRGAGSMGLIRSRKDSDLRSSSRMYFGKYNETFTQEFGLIAMYALSSWQTGTASLGDSDLVLEGGGGSPSAPTARHAYLRNYSGIGYVVNEAGQLLNIYSTTSNYRFLTYNDNQWMAVQIVNPTALLEQFGGSEHVAFRGAWEGGVLTGDMVLPAKDGMVETRYVCTDDVWSPEIAAFPG